jgi:hypothetical protein
LDAAGAAGHGIGKRPQVVSEVYESVGSLIAFLDGEITDRCAMRGCEE